MRPIRLWIACGMLGLLLTSAAQAEVYKWVDEKGRTHYTDKPPDKAKAELLELQLNTYSGAPVMEQNSAALQALGGAKVTLFGTRWCGACKLARSWLRSNVVAFNDLDIESSIDAQREYLRMGIKGVPVIVHGKQRMRGFSPEGMKQLLGKT